MLAVSVYAADSSSEQLDSAHPGFVTVDPGGVSGGYVSTPLAVAALSTAAPVATSDQVSAVTGIAIGTGTVHRNRPLTVGVASESSSEDDLPVPFALPPLALPGSEAGQRPDSGAIKDAVAPSDSAPSVGADAVDYLVAPADQIADPVSAFVGQAVSAAPDVIAPSEEGTQPAMTMLSPRLYS